jgi:hypothetical protein
MSETVEYFELILKPCSLTYGVAPCTAALGTTGSAKCYQSPATCQSPANFAAGEQLVRWCTPSGTADLSVDAIPTLKSASVTPQKLMPGESMGQRESLSVSFVNHQHNDVWFDKYLADRGFNPFNQGTFWPKFAARWPNLKGLECRFVRGLVGQNLNDMERRYYIVDKTSGPDNSGNFSITAKDALTLVDNEKSTAPGISPGLLLTGISESDTTLTLTPTGIGAQYPASGLASIGDEAVRFTRVGDVITLTARGEFRSEQRDHEEGSTFQMALEFVSVEPSTIINTILEYTDLPAEYYNLAAWTAETETHCGRLYTGRIMKPTGVKTLIDELINQVGLIFNCDTITKKISLQVLRNTPSLNAFNDDVFLKGSVDVDRNEDARATQVIFYYGQKNPLKKLDDTENYQAILNTVYTNAQDALEDAPASIRKIYSRWISTNNRPAANAVSQLIVSRYGRAPKEVSFALPRHISPQLGAVVSLQTRAIEDAQGLPAPAEPYLITRVEPRAAAYGVQAQQLNYSLTAPIGDRIVNIDNPGYNLNLKALHDAIYLPAESGDTVIFILTDGGKIGSLSNTLYAARNEGWASGVIVKIDFRGGKIAGVGGDSGVIWNNGYGRSATAGGPGFYTDGPVELINPIIHSGGGGGAYGNGGSGDTWGGAGAGYPPGRAYLNSIGAATETTGGTGGHTGTATDGGAGGDVGQPGTTVLSNAGGAAGIAINGIAFCTITGTSDIQGPQV